MHVDARRRTPTELDLCIMLRARMCVNAAVEINMLDYNIALRSVNGV